MQKSQLLPGGSRKRVQSDGKARVQSDGKAPHFPGYSQVEQLQTSKIVKRIKKEILLLQLAFYQRHLIKGMPF